MILLVRPYFAALCLWLAAWMSATPALAARVSCEDWNTEVFFQRAGVADISRCLKVGAKVNARDEDGSTPLHIAVLLRKTPAVVAALLDAGAYPNARDEDGSTPLHHAAAARWSIQVPLSGPEAAPAGCRVRLPLVKGCVEQIEGENAMLYSVDRSRIVTYQLLRFLIAQTDELLAVKNKQR